MSEFNIKTAIDVFKNYFKTDPNLCSPIINDPCYFLDVEPIETSNFNLNPLLYIEFEDYTQYVLRQLHKYLIECMLQGIATDSPFLQVLKGPSGVGKSTSLFIIAKIAKEMNILTFPINARSFVKKEIGEQAQVFLITWRDTNKAILDDLNQKLDNLFNFDSLTSENAVETMRKIIRKLRIQTIIPVLFIVDDC